MRLKILIYTEVIYLASYAQSLTIFVTRKGRDIKKVIITLCTCATVSKCRCLVAGATSTISPKARYNNKETKSLRLHQESNKRQCEVLVPIRLTFENRLITLACFPLDR